MKLENLFVRAALLAFPKVISQAKDYVHSHQGGAGIIFHNSDTAQVHISFDYNGFTNLPSDVVVPGGESRFFHIPPGISKVGHAFYVGSTPNHRGMGAKRDADTKTEFTLNGYSGHAYFDIDVERGVSVPVLATDVHGEAYAGCSADKMKTCPQAWRHYHSDGRLDQCKNTQTLDAIRFFRQGCPDWYVLSDDRMTKVKSFAKNSKNVLLVVSGPHTSDHLEELRKQAKKIMNS